MIVVKVVFKRRSEVLYAAGFVVGSSWVSPIAVESILFEARRSPTNSKGMIMGHGNLAVSLAKALKAKSNAAGINIAVTQRIEFPVSNFFFSDGVIVTFAFVGMRTKIV